MKPAAVDNQVVTTAEQPTHVIVHHNHDRTKLIAPASQRIEKNDSLFDVDKELLVETQPELLENGV